MNYPPNDDDGGTPPDLSSRIITHHQLRREMNRIRRLNRRRRPFYRVAAEGTIRYIKRFNWKSGLGFTLIGCGTVCGGYWIFCVDGGSTIVTAAGAIGGYLTMQSPMQPFNDIDSMNDLDIDVHHVGRGLLTQSGAGSTTYTSDMNQATNDKALQKLFENRIHSVKIEDELGLSRAIVNINNNWSGKSDLSEADETKVAHHIEKLIKKTLAQIPEIATKWKHADPFPLSKLVAYAEATQSNIMVYVQDYTGSVIQFNKIYIVGAKLDLVEGSKVFILLASITNSNSNGINVRWEWISSNLNADPRAPVQQNLPEFMQVDLGFINGNIESRNKLKARMADPGVFRVNEPPLTLNKPVPGSVSSASIAPQSVQGPPTGSGVFEAAPRQQKSSNPEPPQQQAPPRLVRIAQNTGTSTNTASKSEPQSKQEPNPSLIDNKETIAKKKKEEMEKNERDQRKREIAERNQKEKDQKARDQEARDQKARDQEAWDQKAREQKARDQKARDQEALDQKARDQEALDQKARDQEARDQKGAGGPDPPPYDTKPEPKPSASEQRLVQNAENAHPHAQRRESQTQSFAKGDRDGQRPKSRKRKPKPKPNPKPKKGAPPPPPPSQQNKKRRAINMVIVATVFALLFSVPVACICIGLMIWIWMVQRRRANSAAMNHDTAEPPVADMV